MLNNKNNILAYLKELNLTLDESKIYLELLKGPQSHLELSRITGINRSKIYRVADSLEKKSLVSTRTDDRGSFLTAEDPQTLEVEIVNAEQKVNKQRNIFDNVLPTLVSIKKSSSKNELDFVVNTYEGVEGFKQMLWHELKAKGELIVFGSGELEKLVPNRRWAEQHRAKSVEANYKIRELLNPGKKIDNFTKNEEFKKVFNKRLISEDILFLEHQMVIYNDTVSTYCWRGDQKVGFEVVNKAYSQMMRQMFETYWELAAGS